MKHALALLLVACAQTTPPLSNQRAAVPPTLEVTLVIQNSGDWVQASPDDPCAGETVIDNWVGPVIDAFVSSLPPAARVSIVLVGSISTLVQPAAPASQLTAARVLAREWTGANLHATSWAVHEAAQQLVASRTPRRVLIVLADKLAEYEAHDMTHNASALRAAGVESRTIWRAGIETTARDGIVALGFTHRLEIHDRGDYTRAIREVATSLR